MTSTSTFHAQRLAPYSGRAPDSLVVLLHGYGSNGADLISLAPHWRSALPDTLFVAPDAPQAMPGMRGGFQWWGLETYTRAALAAGAAAAAPGLQDYIDGLLEETGLSEDRLVLVGFSQGTMMALQIGLRRSRPVAGIVGFSGMLVDAPGLAAAIRSRPPVLLVHGSADPVVPVGALHEAKAELERQGVAVESHVSPGLGHSVDPTGLRLGGDFVRKVLARA